MLIYHAARDLNHGMFRMLNLIDHCPAKSVAFDTMRILDFYYLFPHLLAEVSLPRHLIARKRKLREFGSKYSRVPSPHLFIQQLRGTMEVVARSLASKGFIEAPALDAASIIRTDQPLPPGISMAIERQLDVEKALVQLLGEELSQVPLLGPGGLKARTGLLEYRYDPI